MNRKLMLVVIVVVFFLSCETVRITKLGGDTKPSPDEAISVDITGMTPDQQETTKGMIKEIIPLIKA
ncbi:MAG: hypothetical protein KAJ00_11280, partial [Deltaproteobacteria bacterium]|nr:hypothetical protein [Deltaproteobacteria bacterium]